MHILFYLTIAFGLITACHSGGMINQINMDNETTNNPLLCDTATGTCEIPGQAANLSDSPQPLSQGVKPVKIIYFTDPICSACWGIEPQLRKLELEYGDYFEVEYHMGGLLPSWDVYNSGGINKPSDVAHHWDEVSPYYKMPIDGDVWLSDPLPSSYPPSVAWHAANRQDVHKAHLFLRRIREMVFLEKKNITRWEHLAQAAQEVCLDTARLRQDYEGPAKSWFQADLSLSRSQGVRGFPTLFFTDEHQNRLTLYGFRSYALFEQALTSIYPDAVKKTYPATPDFLFRQFSTLTTQEYAVLTNRTYEAAEQVLSQLAQQNELASFRCKNGAIWFEPASVLAH